MDKFTEELDLMAKDIAMLTELLDEKSPSWDADFKLAVGTKIVCMELHIDSMRNMAKSKS